MSGCKPFTININGDLSTILGSVKQQAAQNGVTFLGNTSGGSFSGKISGTYKVSGNIVSVSISLKPLIYPCNRIESELRKYF